MKELRADLYPGSDPGEWSVVCLRKGGKDKTKERAGQPSNHHKNSRRISHEEE